MIKSRDWKLERKSRAKMNGRRGQTVGRTGLRNTWEPVRNTVRTISSLERPGRD